jgi:hypothetical protein
MRSPVLSRVKAERFAWYIDQKYTDQKLLAELLSQGLSQAVATERSTSFQVPITMEGLLCTYKVSREIMHKYVKDENNEDGVKMKDRYDYDVDEITGLKTHKMAEYVEDRVFEPAVQGQHGDAFSCTNLLTGQGTQGHIIKVGHIHELDNWNKVNCNDNTSCVPGLHIGNLDYIAGYQSDGTATHNVFVNPMDIGAIVNDNTGAIRCRRYFVHSSFMGVNRSIYHSSRFAAIGEAEFKAEVAKAVEASKAKYDKDVAGWTALLPAE